MFLEGPLLEYILRNNTNVQSENIFGVTVQQTLPLPLETLLRDHHPLISPTQALAICPTQPSSVYALSATCFIERLDYLVNI